MLPLVWLTHLGPVRFLGLTYHTSSTLQFLAHLYKIHCWLQPCDPLGLPESVAGHPQWGWGVGMPSFVFGSWLMNSCQVFAWLSRVVQWPWLLEGIRYIAIVYIVTHLQSLGSVLVAPPVVKQYFWCWLEYLWCHECICHWPVQWYNFCVAYDVIQCHWWVD